MRWFNDIFLSSFVTRIAYFIFFVTYGISVYYAIIFGMSLFPLQEVKDVVIFTNRDEDTYITKQHLTTFDTPAKNILSVMLKNYVLQREEYVLNNQKAFDVIKKKNDFIKNYSSQDVFANFKDELNTTDSRADALMTNNIETKVQIVNCEFVSDEESIVEHIVNQFIPTGPPKNARVNFMINGQSRFANLSYIFDLPDSKAKGNDAEIKLTVLEYSISRN